MILGLRSIAVGLARNAVLVNHCVHHAANYTVAISHLYTVLYYLYTHELLNHIKSRKLRYFGHVMRQPHHPHDNVEGSVMVGLVEGVRNRGRQRMCWLDNICQWTGLSGDNLLHAVRDTRCWTSQTHPA